jgi:hypothetical protein
VTPGCWEKGKALKQQLPLLRASGWAPTVWSPAFRRRVVGGIEAWVFMLGGDLIVGVISLTTLGLAHLHISLSFSGLVS